MSKPVTSSDTSLPLHVQSTENVPNSTLNPLTLKAGEALAPTLQQDTSPLILRDLNATHLEGNLPATAEKSDTVGQAVIEQSNLPVNNSNHNPELVEQMNGFNSNSTEKSVFENLMSQISSKYGTKIASTLPDKNIFSETSAIKLFNFDPQGKYQKTSSHLDTGMTIIGNQIQVKKEHAETFLQAFLDNPELFGIEDPSDVTINILDEEQWSTFSDLLNQHLEGSRELEPQEQEEVFKEEKTLKTRHENPYRERPVKSNQSASPVVLKAAQAKHYLSETLLHEKAIQDEHRHQHEEERAEKKKEAEQKDIEKYSSMKERIKTEDNARDIQSKEIDPIEKNMDQNPLAPPKHKPPQVTKRKRKPV